VAQRFDMSVEEAAASALRLANANIMRAIQLVSTERGRDPRDYVLVPSAAPARCTRRRWPRILGINTIVVPPHPGVISAYGLLASDYTNSTASRARCASMIPRRGKRCRGPRFGEMRARASWANSTVWG